MIAIVDDEELQKRKAFRIPQNARTDTSIVFVDILNFCLQLCWKLSLN